MPPCALYMGALHIFGTSWLRPRFPNIFMGICSDRLYECSYKIWSPKLYPFLGYMGYPKNLGSPWIRPRSLFSKFLMGFYSDWPYKCTRQIIALPVLEIRGGSQAANPQSRGRGGCEIALGLRLSLYRRKPLSQLCYLYRSVFGSF